MSPEQPENAHAATPQSDVYALGIMWIEMLTGRAPHPAWVAAGRLGRPSGMEELDDLLARMTMFDDVRRPTVDQLREIVADMRTRLARSA